VLDFHYESKSEVAGIFGDSRRMWRIKVAVEFKPFVQIMVKNTLHQNLISTVKMLALNINSLLLILQNKMELVRGETNV
jgi:hypothetical protein